MTNATAEKTRCVATYKNGNPCRAYTVNGYLCTQHQHLCAGTEVQMKIAEIERQNAERERRINEIVAQEAHTRLLTAPALAIPSPAHPYGHPTHCKRFTPFRKMLEWQRERQSELGRLTSWICAWGLEERKYVKSGLLCSEKKSYAEVFPGAKRVEIRAIVNCPNPRVQGRAKCRPCRRETQAMHTRFRKNNEEARACEHGPGCWPSLDDVISHGDGHCYYCGVSVTRGAGKNTDACRDHYIPVSRGGLHCKDNVVLACRHCNGSKHDNIPSTIHGTAVPA